MSDKGWLNTQREKLFGEAFDKAVKSKNPLVELVDGYFGQVSISLIDDNLLDKLNVKDEFKDKFGSFFDAAISEDVPEAEKAAAELINFIIDIPGLNEEEEGLILEGVVKLATGLILKLIKNKKKKIS